ncbi:gamma-interferon-inducible lysosomal thiol reductase-like [Haliotis rufescens]|uniref:gamma-interferon-inducible lysosomal thiol reductase-like n=1 Tax=Haliotis rufescens TaxID=6454 RepID=UPI001EB0385C|nr:gamma-interferon-inducible lysosomal thiol reductase-like [Haliotis rufescens]
MMVLRVVFVVAVVVGVVSGAAVCSDCDGPEPVEVVTYYESMCPFSRKFLTTQLYPTMKLLPDNVMNVTIVPYGFAHEKEENGKWVMYNCQHGPSECVGNAIAACVLNMTSYESREYMPMINCMEVNTRHGHQMEALSKCALANNMSEPEILTCYNSTEGSQLHYQMGQITHAGHIHYVPHINVNGQHSKVIQYNAYNHLLEVVCQLYKGPEPAACKARQQATLVG